MRLKPYKNTLYVIAIAIALIFLVHVIQSRDSNQPRDIVPHLSREQHISPVGKDAVPKPQNVTRPRKILFWTPYFGSKTWDYEHLGTVPFQHQLCRHSCVATNDKSEASTADAILFHVFDIGQWPRDLPDDVIKVLAIHEPPPVVGDRLSKLDGKFDLVISYRRHTPLYAPYRVVRPRDQSRVRRQGPYRPPNDVSSRNRSVVWVVSRCESWSKREVYVSELAKHIDVDIYGKCGPLSCPKQTWADCMRRFEAGYKFYLSFENSLCEDYATEKFYEPLRWDIVPVWFGGQGQGQGQGQRHPAGSEPYGPELLRDAYIDAKAFPSPRHLAEFLKKVGSDAELYNRYFQWKLNYTILTTHGPLTGGLCKLCDLLHTKPKVGYATSSTKLNVNKWWNDGRCDNDFVTRQKAYW